MNWTLFTLSVLALLALLYMRKVHLPVLPQLPVHLERKPFPRPQAAPDNRNRFLIAVPYEKTMGSGVIVPLQETASAGAVVSETPAPIRVPVPTNMTGATPGLGLTGPAPLPPNALASGDPKTLDVNLNQPLDAVMSEWTLWGPCQDNVTRRTRTCIHQGFDGGLMCGHTTEAMVCTK